MGEAVPTSEREVLAGLVERVKFLNAENGFCVLRVKAQAHRDLVMVIGNSIVEFTENVEPGMTAAQVATKEQLPEVIRSLMEAVKFGELGNQIEDVAEKGTADLRLKAKPVLVKRTAEYTYSII